MYQQMYCTTANVQNQLNLCLPLRSYITSINPFHTIIVYLPLNYSSIKLSGIKKEETTLFFFITLFLCVTLNASNVLTYSYCSFLTYISCIGGICMSSASPLYNCSLFVLSLESKLFQIISRFASFIRRRNV